jgi:6,7-dimethyl-8-ribityllumazine synthase
MLTAIKREAARKRGKHSFAIIASRYNARYVDPMIAAAQDVLRRQGAKIQLVRVPGAFEIPVVAARVARNAQSRNRALAGIICLGVILRGETVHAAHIGEAVSNALMKLQLRYEIPIIHEVLLLENEKQAQARCLGKKYNRGAEAAETALAMANILAAL